VYAGLFDAGESAKLALAEGRHAWVHVARGTVLVNGQPAGEGDGVALTGEREVSLEGVGDAEVIVFDLA
jgi:quercetin 2,3-dioxygenase